MQWTVWYSACTKKSAHYIHYTVQDHIHIFKFYWKIYCVQYNIQCTLQYTVHITIYSAHYNIQCTVKYTVYQYNIQSTVQYAVFIILQYTMYSTINRVQYNIQCTVQFTVYSCAVYSIKYRAGNFWRLKHIKNTKKVSYFFVS